MSINTIAATKFVKKAFLVLTDIMTPWSILFCFAKLAKKCAKISILSSEQAVYFHFPRLLSVVTDAK